MKKIGTIMTVLAIMIFGGMFSQDIHASATTTSPSQVEQQDTTSGQYESFFSQFFHTYFRDIFQPHYKQSGVTTEKKENHVQKDVVNDREANQESVKEDNQNNSLSEYAKQVVKLTNQERANRGLQPLEIDIELSNVAQKKSQDMANIGYFSHTSPTYGSPFDMMKTFGVTYRSAGENIARGQKTPEEVVDAWMHSKGHRENILNSTFTHIGVGYVADGNYWTQQFIGK